MGTSVKIDFFVPGISKCGTTTLASLLAQHPDIFIPKMKEPWYFCADNFEQKHGFYDQVYKPAKPGQLLGDCSTSYSSFEKEKIATQRIYKNNPDCKLIFLVRNPKARMISSYKEMHHSAANFGLTAPYALGECLEMFPQIVKDSLYWERLKIYRDTFGDDSIIVVFMQDLLKDRISVLKACFEHLGVDPNKFPDAELEKLNDGDQKRYDSRLLRFLWMNKLTGPRTSKLTHAKPELMNKLGLRRKFGGKTIKWDAGSLKILEDQIHKDSRQFLKHYNKPAAFWGLETQAG